MLRNARGRVFLLFMIALFLILIAGCGTLENGRGWGQDALYPVNGKRVVKTKWDRHTSRSCAKGSGL